MLPGSTRLCTPPRRKAASMCHAATSPANRAGGIQSSAKRRRMTAREPVTGRLPRRGSHGSASAGAVAVSRQGTRYTASRSTTAPVPPPRPSPWCVARDTAAPPDADVDSTASTDGTSSRRRHRRSRSSGLVSGGNSAHSSSSSSRDRSRARVFSTATSASTSTSLYVYDSRDRRVATCELALPSPPPVAGLSSRPPPRLTLGASLGVSLGEPWLTAATLTRCLRH